MRQIDKHRPTTFQDVVGNKKTIDRLYRVLDDNDGFGGLVIMLQGQTGNGKTLLADIIAKYIDGELYRPNCTKDSETAAMIEQIRRDTKQCSMFSNQSVYIFDEADKLHPDNIANLKTAIDQIDRRRQDNLPCRVTVIFTSAKTKEQLTAVQQGHWDELCTRCITCKLAIQPEELDGYFASLTGGAVPNISKRISVLSMRSAWEYIEDNEIDIVKVK
jgi:chromosomal replication initiation ATPase DnaA